MSDPRLSFVTQATGHESGVLNILNGTAIVIHVAPEALRSSAGQVLTFQLSSLLTRLFDQVAFEGDTTVQALRAVPFVQGPFLDGLAEYLPRLRHRVNHESPSSQKVNIVIGLLEQAADLYLGCSSWGARVSYLGPQPLEGNDHTLGALAAGSLGAAEVFKLIFKELLTTAYLKPEYSFSLLDYGTIGQNEPIYAGPISVDLTLFGAGSIGMGFLQGAALSPWLNGRLTVVDNGKFDDRNPVKYSLLDAATGDRRSAKAPWAEETLNLLVGHRLQVRGFEQIAEQYVAHLPADYVLPLALSAVDTYEARLEIQDTLPGFLLNAGIDGTLAEVSAHTFGKGACLACLALRHELESWNAGPLAQQIGLSPARVHELLGGNLGLTTSDLEQIRSRSVLPPDVLGGLEAYLDQPLLSLWNRVGYADSTLTVQGTPVKVSSAFVSAFAGVLLLAETLKHSVSSLRHHQVNNSFRLELLGVPTQSVMVYERDVTKGCLCHSGFRQRVYAQKYPASVSV